MYARLQDHSLCGSHLRVMTVESCLTTSSESHHSPSTTLVSPTALRTAFYSLRELSFDSFRLLPALGPN
ncbi:hypothetical protein CBOM_07927 [Ceraceosorus bombacis]|uniref:Uncharacterized protein n=1 Tax=Ceraceosorus bombacis TaxID=401625 RepID=A0A0P1BPH7_9BASI|nr:hypothetical protein CBOM_07927 [Ceraceosorus bombacis]